MESLSGCEVPERAGALRVLVVELERFTMHLHDIANICGMGTGYTVMAANGFRVVERLRRLSARLFGNRFFRGLVVPGGVAAPLTSEQLADAVSTVDEAWREASALVRLALDSDTLRDRLETTGRAAESRKPQAGLQVRARDDRFSDLLHNGKSGTMFPGPSSPNSGQLQNEGSRMTARSMTPSRTRTQSRICPRQPSAHPSAAPSRTSHGAR